MDRAFSANQPGEPPGRQPYSQPAKQVWSLRLAESLHPFPSHNRKLTTPGLGWLQTPPWSSLARTGQAQASAQSSLANRRCNSNRTICASLTHRERHRTTCTEYKGSMKEALKQQHEQNERMGNIGAALFELLGSADGLCAKPCEFCRLFVAPGLVHARGPPVPVNLRRCLTTL